MALQVEDVNHAFPYGLALERLGDGHGLHEAGLPPCWRSMASRSWSASTSCCGMAIASLEIKQRPLNWADDLFCILWSQAGPGPLAAHSLP